MTLAGKAPEPLPPLPGKGPGKGPEKGPEKRLEAVKGIRGALADLKKQLEAKEGKERGPNVDVALEHLLNYIRQAREAHRSVPNNPAWARREAALTGNVTDIDLNTLRLMLIDGPEGLQLEAAHLSDEIEGTEEYLRTFGGAPDERIWNQIGQWLEEHIPPETRKRMEEWGVTLDTVRNLAASLFAAVLERFATMLPPMAQISGGLRWRIAAADAQRDERLTAEERKRLADPAGAGEIQKQWQTTYRAWLQRKNTAQSNKVNFTEPCPGIYDALHPPVAVAQDKPPPAAEAAKKEPGEKKTETEKKTVVDSKKPMAT